MSRSIAIVTALAVWLAPISSPAAEKIKQVLERFAEQCDLDLQPVPDIAPDAKVNDRPHPVGTTFLEGFCEVNQLIFFIEQPSSGGQYALHVARRNKFEREVLSFPKKVDLDAAEKTLKEKWGFVDHGGTPPGLKFGSNRYHRLGDIHAMVEGHPEFIKTLKAIRGKPAAGLPKKLAPEPTPAGGGDTGGTSGSQGTPDGPFAPDPDPEPPPAAPDDPQESSNKIPQTTGDEEKFGLLKKSRADKGRQRPVVYATMSDMRAPTADERFAERGRFSRLILTDGEDIQIREFHFRHAWVHKIDLTEVGTAQLTSNRKTITIQGIFPLFNKLCGAARLTPFERGETDLATQVVGPERFLLNGVLAAKSMQSAVQGDQRSFAQAEAARSLIAQREALPSAGDAKQERNPRSRTGSSGEPTASSSGSSDEVLAALLDLLSGEQELSVPAQVEKLQPLGEPRIDLSRLVRRRLAFQGEPLPASPGRARRTLLGGQESAEFGGGGRSGVTLNAAIICDPTTNTVIISDKEQNMAAYDEIARMLDRPPKIVEITAAIFDIRVTEAFEWGVDYGFKGVKRTGPGTRLSGLGIFNGDLAEGFEKRDMTSKLIPSPFRGGTSSFVPSTIVGGEPFGVAARVMGPTGEFYARVQALQGEKRAKVLLRPSVVTTDGVKALFYDNDSVVISAPGEHNAELFKVNAPIAFEVTPRVLPTIDGKPGDGSAAQIRLEINIVDSAFMIAAADAKDAPFIDESKITTRAVVPQGQSLLIGGRYRTHSVKDESGVPFLKRIPIIGLAAKDKIVEKARLQRLFLITPRVIDPNRLLPADLAQPRKLADR